MSSWVYVATKKDGSKIVLVSDALESKVSKALSDKYGGTWDLTRIGSAYHGVDTGVIVSRVKKH